MTKAFLALLLVPALVSPAHAADRRIAVGSFDHIRVDGPFDVKVVTSRSPSATISGDPRETDDIEVRVDGTTLVVRKGLGGWGEQPRGRAPTPVLVQLATPKLVAASVVGGGRLNITGMKALRVDLAVSGASSLAVTGADTDQLTALVIGTGQIALAGRAARARLTTNGSGAIDAAALDTGDVVVRLDGVGETKAHARFTAEVTNTGLGQVTIAGPAKCLIKSAAGGPVRCSAGSD